MKAVLFDVDGVLFESSEAIYQVFRTVLTGHGLKVPPRNEVMKWFGLRVPPWLKKMGVNAGTEIAREIEERYVNEFIPKYGKVGEDLVESLNALRAGGAKLGVVTNQTDYQVKQALKPVDFEFDCVVTADHGREKPAPDLLLKAIKTLGVEKQEAIYVGDTETDVEAGRAAGIKTLVLARHYNKGLPNRIHSLSYLIKEYTG